MRKKIHLVSNIGYDKYYFEKKHKKLLAVSDKFYNQITTSQKKTPTFYDIFMFNCLRSKTYTSAIDRKYWEEKGWLEKSYFYDVRLNPIKQIFGNIIKYFIHIMGSRYTQKSDSATS